MAKATIILTGDEAAIHSVISSLEGQPVEIRPAGVVSAELAELLGAPEFASPPTEGQPYGIQVSATSLNATAWLLASAAGGRLGQNPVLNLGLIQVSLNQAHARAGILLKLLLDVDYKGIEPLVLADILLHARIAADSPDTADSDVASAKIARQALIISRNDEAQASEILDKARWWLQLWSWVVHREAAS